MTLEDYSEEWVRRQEAISERSRCFVCLEKVTEDAKLVSLRGAGYVTICDNAACAYAIDARRAHPVMPKDAVKL